MRKMEILPFAPAQMDLEGIMKSKVNQTKKTNAAMWNLKINIKLIETIEKWLPETGGGENRGRLVKRYKTFSYKMNKF